MTPDEYRQAIGELARGATMPDGVAANIEARLEQAFERARAETPALRLRRASFTALAAAAALVLAAGGVAWYSWGPITVNNVTETARPEIGASERDIHLKVDATEASQAARSVRLQADATLADGHRSRSVRLPPSPRLRRTAVASAEAGQADRKHAKRLPPVIRPAGFVAVPTAAGLPRFESGVIVRMSLPVTALPSFGVDISPASGDQPVEADVLVGQDGLARAIRLVNTSRSQQ
jgi:hypothetical protein